VELRRDGAKALNLLVDCEKLQKVEIGGDICAHYGSRALIIGGAHDDPTGRAHRGTEAATSLTAPNDFAIRRALEEAGIEFIDKNGAGKACD
jgi:hypothetical protein